MTRAKFIVFLALVVVTTMAGWLTHAEIKPVGKISREDVLEIRALIGRGRTAALTFNHSYMLANIRHWRFWLLDFRIWLSIHKATVIDIKQNSIGTVTIQPDGTRGALSYAAFVRYRTFYSSTESRVETCRVLKRDGQWILDPKEIP